MKRKLLFFTILLAVFMVSCKSTRQMEKGAKATSFNHLITLVKKAEPSFSTMNANNISINADINGKRTNVSANLKIKTDSVLVLSIIPFMGIEMYSVELYPDKWILYDKINRMYYTDNYEYLYYRFGINVDYCMFQSLFSAKLFAIGGGNINVNIAQYTPLESNKSRIDYTSGNISQTIFTTASHNIEQVVLQDKSGNNTLTTSYYDYIETRGINYPRNIVIDFSNEDTSVINMNMKIQKISFNSDLKISLSNPERYTRSTIDQLIK